MEVVKRVVDGVQTLVRDVGLVQKDLREEHGTTLAIHSDLTAIGLRVGQLRELTGK